MLEERKRSLNVNYQIAITKYRILDNLSIGINIAILRFFI